MTLVGREPKFHRGGATSGAAAGAQALESVEAVGLGLGVDAEPLHNYSGGVIGTAGEGINHIISIIGSCSSCGVLELGTA